MANQTLAVSFVLPGVTIDMDAIDADPGIRLARCMSTLAKKGQYLDALFGRPTLIAEGVNTNDTTPVALQLVDLTDQGITFPTGTWRQIKWRHWIQTDNDQFYVEYERWVQGGTTPVLLGTRRVVHAHGVIATANVAYGNVHAQSTYAVDTATAVPANSSAGSSLGTTSTNTTTFTHPVARATPKYIRGLNSSADVATASESLHTAAFEASSTTFSVFSSDLATPTGDGFDDVGVLDVEAFILPPGECDLVMNSNAVEMQVTGIASDETRHRVEIFVGQATLNPFQGAA